MNATVRRLGTAEFQIAALIARWRAATNTFTWVNCGHQHAYLVDTEGNLAELPGPIHPRLGSTDTFEFAVTERQLHPTSD